MHLSRNMFRMEGSSSEHPLRVLQIHWKMMLVNWVHPPIFEVRINYRQIQWETQWMFVCREIFKKPWFLRAKQSIIKVFNCNCFLNTLSQTPPYSRAIPTYDITSRCAMLTFNIAQHIAFALLLILLGRNSVVRGENNRMLMQVEHQSCQLCPKIVWITTSKIADDQTARFFQTASPLSFSPILAKTGMYIYIYLSLSLSLSLSHTHICIYLHIMTKYVYAYKQEGDSPQLVIIPPTLHFIIIS